MSSCTMWYDGHHRITHRIEAAHTHKHAVNYWGAVLCNHWLKKKKKKKGTLRHPTGILSVYLWKRKQVMTFGGLGGGRGETGKRRHPKGILSVYEKEKSWRLLFVSYTNFAFPPALQECRWDLLERCASIPKITGSNPSGDSKFTFRSDLLLTARGGSTWALLVEFACLPCYPGNTLCSRRLEPPERAR
jgi:hypothetical protein